jgi:hypothetical protein
MGAEVGFMQNLLVAWRFFLLAVILVFPQLFGILLYFRLSRAPRWIVSIVAALAPAVVFFWLERIILGAQLRELYASGERCGMPAFGAILLLYTGTIFQLVLGLFTQFLLHLLIAKKPPVVPPQ